MTTNRTMRRLVTRSSLGTPGARAIRSRTPRHVTTRILTATTKTSTTTRRTTHHRP